MEKLIVVIMVLFISASAFCTTNVQMSGRWGDAITENAPVKVDALTESLVTISNAHQEVHEGVSFYTTVFDTSMAAADTITIAFRTPTGTKRAHAVVQASTLVGGLLEVWEDATWTAGTGDTISLLNRKREDTMTSSGLTEDLTDTTTWTASDFAIVNPAGVSTASATKLHRTYSWGVNELDNGIGSWEIGELIYKPATKYVIIFTAVGGTNKGQIFMNWYEQTDLH